MTDDRRRRGTGTIEDAPGGRFRVRLTTTAGRLSLGVYDSHEEAEGVLAGALDELREEHVKALTLRLWAARALDRREHEGYASVDDDRSRWNSHIELDPLADLPLRTITTRDVRDFMDRVVVRKAKGARAKGQKLSRQTCQNILNLLRALLAAAVERDLLTANPAATVKVPKRVSRTQEPWTYLRLDELEALLACAALPERDRLWISVAIGTGMREGEQFNLKLVDIRLDGEHPEVTVRYGSKNRGPKNTRGATSKIRRVPLFGLGLDAMRAWLAQLPTYAPKNPLGLAFPGPTGARRQPGKHLHRTVRLVGEDGRPGKPRPVDPLPSYLAAAGIVRAPGEATVTWHSFRHTCGAGLVSGYWGRRWSLEEVRALMGHGSASTTERYAHLADSALRAAAAETRKPAISPRRRRLPPPETLGSIGKPSLSHLRDLNSRPTVYEAVALPNNSAHLDTREAQARAYDAQTAAREALEAIAGGGHWTKAIALLATIATGEDAADGLAPLLTLTGSDRK